jgi:D-alanine--poly(phosphoribitol) ligase subunit 1
LSALLAQGVGQLFAAVAARHADRAALALSESRSLSYRELDALSNQAARFLLSRGIRKGDRVALSLEKGPAAYALILAALKVGAPYVALDPRNPAARTAAILEQCAPSLLFCGATPELQEAAAIAVLCPETQELPAFCSAFPAGSLEAPPAIAASDPAYLMFTSGSTGVPKGAMIGHDNLLHFIEWVRGAYGFEPGDVHTHLNPLYFDNSVFDIYSTFFTGGCLVPFDAATVQDPSALVARLRAMRCGVWFSVPSLLMFLQVMKEATRANLGGLRKIIFGGEGFPKPKLKALFDELGSQTELHNVYGPTECTCICSSHRISAADFAELEGFPTLGRLAAQFSGHILDGDRAVEPGEIGELCLGGPCVGLGYVNRPDLTKAAFVQNPANASSQEILYRTGDLVRQDPATGYLHFAGRRDLQVKHMGYRIELEEIQHALASIPGVDEAVVLHRRRAELSELVAVIASKQALGSAEVRKALANRVPRYMVPSEFHILERMPKNANGKTDRNALSRQFGG